MARHLRIEFPGAFYHVYSRGNQKQVIFLSDDDRYYLMKILGDAYERLSAGFHVYCLMANHYHFILETPLGNLSQIMHFINTAYSVYLNVKHDRCGHLFQGRYKAILMDSESYAKILTMYIHGNPVRKKIAACPEDYEWSSYRAYLAMAPPQHWLRYDMIRRLFGNDVGTLRAEHDKYLRSKMELSSIPEIARAERIGILGSDEFIETVRRSHVDQIVDKDDGELLEIPRLRNRPEVAEIFSRVVSQMGEKNRLVKKVTIFIAHKNTNHKLREIGEFFGIGPIAVAVAFRKMGRELAYNKPLLGAIAEIETAIFGRPSKSTENYKN
jgi:putative transposase